MAPLECPLAVDCNKGEAGAVWKTADLPFQEAKLLLDQHLKYAHGHDDVIAQKLERPVIKLGVGEEDYLFFVSEWSSYKRDCGLTDVSEVRDQLKACCDSELRTNL
eukprot:GFUD01101200.1.p1 GENE.GFUD01101200.1~~GFUD01101200.1.p1  ORF type:complete len:106 (+),score=27.06 GFUD01101200.1:197-514(+)